MRIRSKLLDLAHDFFSFSPQIVYRRLIVRGHPLSRHRTGEDPTIPLLPVDLRTRDTDSLDRACPFYTIRVRCPYVKWEFSWSRSLISLIHLVRHMR